MIKSGWEKFRESFYLQYAALLVAAFLFVGKPVPYSNENSYLLRLVKAYHPNFLLNDITFSTPANEHWLFDHIFGLLTFVFSIEFIGWTGRILCWTILLYALLRLGQHWKIPLWTISFSIFLWLCLGQSIVGDEWIIGVFEAKCVAYICLLFALDGFCRGKEIFAAVLLGLSFSFHPAVGLWGIPATILALAICRFDLIKIVKITFISGVFSLFGLVPLLFSEIGNNINTPEDWKFFVLVGYPFHFDPFAWARSSIVLLFFIMAFCLMFYFQNKRDEKDESQKFLTTFLTILFLFFCLGLFLRAFGQFELLRLMPMRLFPVFAPLFFLFALAKAFQKNVFAPPVNALMIVGFLCLLGWISPFSSGFTILNQTFHEWRAGTDDAAKSFIWLKENTPNGTVVIAPPWRNDFWYRSERAEVVSYVHAPVSNLGEWQTRLNALIGESPLEKGVRKPDGMKEFYNKLTAEQIVEIANRYKAEYLVSESDYAFPTVFSSGTYKVYDLRR